MIKKEKSDFNILTDKFSTRPSIEMIKQTISNHICIDADDLEYVEKHPFMIPNLTSGILFEEKYTGLVSRKSAAIYPFNLKKYRSKGMRLPTSRTGVTKEGEEKSYPNYEREQKGSQYVLRVYEIPLRNVRAFVQSGNENYVSIINDGSLEYLERRWRGHPEHINGVFSIEHAKALIDGITIAINAKKNYYNPHYNKRIVEHDFDSIDVRIDVKRGTFVLVDRNNNIVTDTEILKTLFNPFK